MPTPKEILVRHNIKPLKRYGQSFLIDPNIIERIAASAQIGPDDRVVEIGAGAGIMTGILAERAGRVIALEVDGRMVDVLNKELKDRPNVTVCHRDVLTYDFEAAAGASGSRLIVVGNIPYNISSQIVIRLIRYRESISAIVLMFQKEVAERIVALPDTGQYGILSVLTAMYMHSVKVTAVPPGCFYPKPRVDSTVLKMTVREKPLIDLKDPELFQKLVRAAFSKRRKTLVNSLKNNPFILVEDKELSRLVDRTGFDVKRRGETLTVEDFGRMANLLFDMRSSGAEDEKLND